MREGVEASKHDDDDRPSAPWSLGLLDKFWGAVHILTCISSISYTEAFLGASSSRVNAPVKCTASP